MWSSPIGRSFFPIPGKPSPPFFAFAFAASSESLAFSTFLRALAAKLRLVLRVVVKAALKRDTICASCCRRASPTFSEASAYFSRAVARGSEGSRRCAEESEARPRAWLKVFGAVLVPGFVKAACASAAEEADARCWTFSETLRERSTKDSR